MKYKKIGAFLILSVVISTSFRFPVFAQDAQDPVLIQKEQEINDLKQKLATLDGQEDINGGIELHQLQEDPHTKRN